MGSAGLHPLKIDSASITVTSVGVSTKNRQSANPARSREKSSLRAHYRNGAFHLLRRERRMFPFIERNFADGGYAGQDLSRYCQLSSALVMHVWQ
jgi:hypothetical protein